MTSQKGCETPVLLKLFPSPEPHVQYCTALYAPTPPRPPSKFKKSEQGGLKIEQINVFLNVLQPFCPAKPYLENVYKKVKNIKKNIKKKVNPILNPPTV